MDTWTVTETAFAPAERFYREAVCAIGNGFIGTRGTFEEGYGDDVPVTLIHGLFDDAAIVHTELVNAPDWLATRVKVGEDWFRLDQGTVVTYERTLDLRRGRLSRTMRWRSPNKHLVDITFERFASMHNPHLAVVRCSLTSVNYTGSVEVRAALSAIVDNSGYRHLRLIDQGSEGQRAIGLLVATEKTEIRVAEAAYVTASSPGAVTYAARDCPWCPYVVVETRLRPGGTLSVDKVVSIHTSQETTDPYATAVRESVAEARRSAAMLQREHEAVWADLWLRSTIEIEGDAWAERAVRFSIYHLLIAAPQLGEKVSIPAKTLSGFGYRGHVFWDTEIFMLPLFTYTQPEMARRLLMYRYHTLPGARRKARDQGYEGAMYAWESAATGDEATPRWVPVWTEDQGMGELVRIWCGDIEHHITADVAYGVVQYWQVTGDNAFMRDYGAEIVLSAARFWGSRAIWDASREAYVIEDVIGPDENHEHVDNNAFTNGMAKWVLTTARELLDWLGSDYPQAADRLTVQLDLTEERLEHWASVATQLAVEVDRETGVIEQFDGFHRLEAVDLADYEPRSKSMQALLGIEQTQRYQVLKQPDVLMLAYLVPDSFSGSALRANWDHYTPRTDLAHGSSLGPPVQAALAARLGKTAEAYRLFRLAAATDLEDVRGNTAEGIHGATAGGVWQAVVHGFAGIRLADGGPVASPNLPAHWRRLAFSLHYRGQRYDFDLMP